MKNLIDRVRTYFRSSKDELMSVSWPTREDIIRYTGLVVVTCIVFGAFFSALDLGLTKGVQAIIAKRNANSTTQQAAPTQPVTPSVEVNPIDVQATTPDGAPTDIKVEQVPVVAPSTSTN
ncbi:preprotein translocase subunit SecE [Patescibacteria group bacterium]|nr:preprotein translocase subunit SecE [Patescibacteria group bacterium]